MTKIEYWWDDQDPHNEGWYAVAKDEAGDILDDSEKVWFPVAVDDYGIHDGDELGEALREAFPAAKIVAR